MRFLASHRIGRVCLHLAAMIADRHVKWHLAGIRRELSSTSLGAVFSDRFQADRSLLT
jgi:hypothetical protein